MVQKRKLLNKTAHTSATEKIGINTLLAGAPGRAFSTKTLQKASLGRPDYLTEAPPPPNASLVLQKFQLFKKEVTDQNNYRHLSFMQDVSRGTVLLLPVIQMNPQSSGCFLTSGNVFAIYKLENYRV